MGSGKIFLHNNKDVYFFNSPRAQKNWLEFCKIKSNQFLNKQSKLRNIIQGKKVVLYLFGTFFEYCNS